MTDDTVPGDTVPNAVPDDTVLDRWVAHVAAELGVPAGSVDVGAVLDLARDAAHQVARPAAPVTTYVAGYAAGLAAARGTSSGTSSGAAGDGLDRASALALAWRDPGPGAARRTDGTAGTAGTDQNAGS